jgi:hypothetical protein
MRPDDYMDFDGVGLAELVHRGDVTAAELAEAAIAPLGDDARLLSLAAWLERERPWQERLAELRSRFS